MLKLSRHFRTFRAIASATFLAVASTVLAPNGGIAGPPNLVTVAPSRSQTAAQPIVAAGDARSACVAATAPDPRSNDYAPQLQNSYNRIEGQDWSRQDLSGRNFSGKVLVNVKLKGARLRGVHLTDAIICGSDLTGADLTGARLDRALIGGGTLLNDADLTKASARSLAIADASYAGARIDGADLRSANIFCDLGDDWPRCSVWNGPGESFASMVSADLRGATLHHLCCSPPGLGTAHLDGLTTQLHEDAHMDFAQLAKGVGESGRMTFMPDWGHSGPKTDLTGKELGQLAAALGQMQSASAKPSFNCARARTEVEKAICADPKLAALDSALNWLWERVDHTPEQNAAQKAWLAARSTCPSDAANVSSGFSRFDFVSATDSKGCIGFAYARRIKELAPRSSPAAIGSVTYTTDSPLHPPPGDHSAIARKFLIARGYWGDQIAVTDWGNGAGKISGDGIGANGHICGFESSEMETKRTGSLVRIDDGSGDLGRDEESGISIVITPQVALRVGGSIQYGCGARANWADVYFRQPDDLVSKVRSPSP
jgi:uncharacterized protein YjbI with pentapeptide repeats